MYARIIVVGRLIADPELRTVDGGSDNAPRILATGCLSVNRPYKRAGAQYPESDLFNFETWGKEAEALVNQCQKGRHILIEGTPEFFEDKAGVKRMSIRKGTWRHVGPAPASAPSGGATTSAQPSDLDNYGF